MTGVQTCALPIYIRANGLRGPTKLVTHDGNIEALTGKRSPHAEIRCGVAAGGDGAGQDRNWSLAPGLKPFVSVRIRGREGPRSHRAVGLAGCF